MLYIGLIFVAIGLYLIFEDFYDLEASFKNKELIELENVEKDGFYKVKATLGIFCIVIGLLAIVNYIVY